MPATHRLDTKKAFNMLLKGRDSDRRAVIASLHDPDQPIDGPELCGRIIEALSGDYKARPDEGEFDAAVRVRRWLLSALTGLGGDDPRAATVARSHLDPKTEPDERARFWALAGLVEAGAADIEELSRDVIKTDKRQRCRMLAQAVLASTDDDAQKRLTRTLKPSRSNREQMPLLHALRALRIIPVQQTVPHLIKIVESSPLRDGYCEEPTYWAIVALGRVQSDWPQAKEAAEALHKCVAVCRGRFWLDDVRSAAVRAIGGLRARSEGDLLTDELTDDNPTIILEAARALQQVLGTRGAVDRVVAVASEAEAEYTEGYASALRWMRSTDSTRAVEDELERLMVSGPLDQQETARLLLAEVGGLAAFQKLRARTESLADYRQQLGMDQEKIRAQFDTSMTEARRGFAWSTYMDVTVFALGALLIAASAALLLLARGDLSNWAGVSATGGPGVLAVLYGTLVAKPRRQVQEAADHLMHLKIVFLGYLRQLHQADQAYARRILEDQHLGADELRAFAGLVDSTMRDAIQHLRSPGPVRAPSAAIAASAEIPAVATPTGADEGDA